jgi:hypothetical protein
LGSFDFAQFDDLALGSVIGKLYLAFFLITNIIIFSNLLIAIFASTFTNIQSNKKSLYLGSIVESLPRYKFHKAYGAYVCGITPLNLIALLITPIFFACGKSR